MILDRLLPNRFAKSARQCVVSAMEEARTLGHDTVGDDDLLLGILREEESGAAESLRAVGVTLETAREEARRCFEDALASIGIHLEDVIGKAGETFEFGTPRSSHVPFSPGAKKALEQSLREAVELGDHKLAPEHVLLGVIRSREGAAARLLGGLGVELEDVEKAVLRARNFDSY